MTANRIDPSATVLTSKQLLGPDQGWFAYASDALRDDGQLFFVGDVKDALTGDKQKLRIGDPLDWPYVSESVAQHLDDLLQDLARRADPVDSLRRLLSTFELHGLVTTHGGPAPLSLQPRWTEPDDRVRAAITIASSSPQPSAGFGALLLHTLGAGTNVGRRRRPPSVSMPVLFYNDGNKDHGRTAGEVGTLTLTSWPGGPPGLHPDPRTMTFSTVDGDARIALGQAMNMSRHPDARSCVTWSARGADGTPVRSLEGQSLGAATALLLRELTVGDRAIAHLAWWLRPRRLRRDWTVTAGLDGSKLTRVAHYDAKLESVAALAKPLHVAIAPADDTRAHGIDDPAVISGRNLGVDVRPLKTIDELTGATRTLNKTFAFGVMATLVILAAFAGVGAWAANAIQDANLAADRRSAATEMMQQSRQNITRDPRIAALTALAADDLDPSIRSQQLMSDVLSANPAIAGSAQVSSTYIEQLVVSAGTLLVLDGDQKVTAWALPSFEPLGTVINEGAKGLAIGGPADVSVLVGSELHFFHTASGYSPVEVETVETGLDSAGVTVFGPYTSGDGVLVLDENFDGAYFDDRMARPFTFSAGDGAGLIDDPRRGTPRVRAVAPSGFSESETPEGRTQIASVGVATTSQQVVDVIVTGAYTDNFDHKDRRVEVRTVMPASEVRAPITSIAPGPENTVLLGTDRGLQQWDPATYETVEFPYKGWTDQVDALEQGVVRSGQRLGFVLDSSLLPPETVQVSGSVFTTVAAGSWSGEFGDLSNYYFAGSEDGTVTVIDPTGSRFGPGQAGGSNVQQFTPSGHLLQTSGSTPQRSDAVTTTAVPDVDSFNKTASSDVIAEQPADPYVRTYSLPDINGNKPYINDAAATPEWVVASGRRADGMGALWTWRLAGGEYTEPVELVFGSGESGEDPVPDIVTEVDFVGGGQIVAVNGAKGQLGFWQVGTFEPSGQVDFPRPQNDTTYLGVALAVSNDRSTVAVRTSGTTVQLVDAVTHRITQTVEVPGAELSAISLSPDGRRLIVVDRLRTVRLIDTTKPKGQTLVSREYDAIIASVEYSPTGDRIAVTFPTASRVEVSDAGDLGPLGPPWVASDNLSVVDASWSVDGHLLSVGTLATADSQPVNGPTEVLDPTMLTWRQQLCVMAGRNFTTEEWRDLSDSTLPRPSSCDWQIATPEAPDSEAAIRPASSGDLTKGDLMAFTPVPALCGHDAGALILGELPNTRPMTGGVYLDDTRFGDLTGDGVADAIADINCNAGGVSFPSTLAAYTRGSDGRPQLIEAISVDDQRIVGPQGSERPFTTSVDIIGGAVHAEVMANVEGDAACCPSLPLSVTLTVSASGGALQVAAVEQRRDLMVMNQLVTGVQTASITGIDFEQSDAVATDVFTAVTKFANTYVGIDVGECVNAEELPDDLSSRISETAPGTPTAQYCTIVAAPGEKATPLLVQLTPDGDSWIAATVIP